MPGLRAWAAATMALGGSFPLTGKSVKLLGTSGAMATALLSVSSVASPQWEGDTWQEKNMELESGAKENKRVSQE